MTTAVYNLSKSAVIVVQADGKASVEVPLHVFCSIDGTLAEVAAQAQEQPGTPIVVPSTARVPRPRNSVVYGIQL